MSPFVEDGNSASGLIVRSALVTTAGIGGSVAVVFLSVGLWLSGMGFAPPSPELGFPFPWWFMAVGVVTVFLPPFVGGAFWGWGLARVFDRPTGPAMRTGALAFGGMTLLTAGPTDATQLWLDTLPGWMPFGVHGYFTIVFMVEVALVASVASWRLAKRLDEAIDAWSVGLWTGGGAAAGFLVGSILAAAVGFRIFPWVRLSMVWAFLVSLPFSTLAAGGILGWRVHLRAGRSDKHLVATGERRAHT